MFYSMVLAHFISDYILQTDRLIEIKKDTIFKGNLIHAIHIAVSSLIIYVITYFLSERTVATKLLSIESLLIILGISISHFIIDFLKNNYFLNKYNNILVEIIDQITHIITIYIILQFISLDNYVISDNTKITIIFITVLIINTCLGDQLIKKILMNYREISNTHENNIKSIGSIIGKIERGIMLTLLLAGYEIGIIAVITIKSIIRFKEFQEKDNDYYILGNLMSLLIVVISYIIWIGMVNTATHPGKLFVEIFTTFIK